MPRPSLQNTFLLFTAALLFIAVLNSGCETLKSQLKENPLKKQKEKRVQKKIDNWNNSRPKPQPVRLPMGTVHMVHPGGEFVLIQSARKLSPSAGSTINTYGPDGRETSTLSMSEASKGGFITADIVSGKPARGDRAVANYIPPGATGDSNAGPNGETIQVLE